jgi:serine/threonine protein kinase
MGNFFYKCLLPSKIIRSSYYKTIVINYHLNIVVKKYDIKYKKSIQNELKMMSIFPSTNVFFLIPFSYKCIKNKFIFKYHLYGIDVLTFFNKYNNDMNHDMKFNIMSQIIKAVKCMHSNRIVHNDLKFENVLIDIKTLQIKLIDFEYCSFWNEPKQMYGTLSYIAPELLLNDYEFEYVSGKQDIWSIGIMLFIIYNNSSFIPFQDDEEQDITIFNYQTLISKINRNKDINPFIFEIILKCLHLDPNHRINIFQLHDLFKI